MYTRLAQTAKNNHNRILLIQLADMEERHADFWKQYTHEDVRPHAGAVWGYPLLARLLGLTFAINLFELSVSSEEQRYRELLERFPEIAPILEDEEEHENKVIEMLHDPFLENTSSIVLGLNDALVELTGAMAGFTFALADTRIIAVAGFITGISATLSMVASEYLSTKSEEGDRNPFVAAGFTGIAYLAVVLLFIAPYFFLTNPYGALGIVIAEALSVIAFFAFYQSVTRRLPWGRQFREMAAISLGVALFTFIVAVVIRSWFGIQI